jgi:hypothetical protein
MYSSTLALTSAPGGLGGHSHVPTVVPHEKTRYPLYRRLGGPQVRSGKSAEILVPTGFDHRTVQP